MKTHQAWRISVEHRLTRLEVLLLVNLALSGYRVLIGG